MKSVYKFIQKYIDLWDALAVICYSVFTWYWSSHVKSIITEILAGIPNEGSIIEIVPLGKWLFLFAFYFFIISRKLSKNRKILPFILYRYRYFKTWWKRHFIAMHIIDFIIFIISCVIWGMLELFDENFTNENFGIILVFFLHLSVWISVLVVNDIIFSAKITPCILLIFEGMLYIISVNFNLPFLVCGMYVNCSYSKLGIIAMVVYAIEILTIAICYLIVPKLWKLGYLERKVIGCQVQ
ncbi:hypothetical protein IMSAGC011_01602 [Lachnospiraceae bacterium]|nr:hypothetical protein IMSAGC011_01602 [Lachnospiraceae bacterium]